MTVAHDERKTTGTVMCFRTRPTYVNLDGMYLYKVAYADLRWISKFPDEQEWLMVPFSPFCLPCVQTEHGFCVGQTSFPSAGLQRKEGIMLLIGLHNHCFLAFKVCKK